VRPRIDLAATDWQETAQMTRTDHTTLHLGYFSRSVVSAVARHRGLYAEAGLTVTETPVESSPGQFRSLLAGEFDLVLTSPDNVAAYRLSAANPLNQQADVRILLGVDAGMGLTIVASDAISSIGELRGRTVAVDVPQSGFALVFLAMLATAGLQPERDFTLVSLGSTPRRKVALTEGRCDATMLNAGHDIAAELEGCRRLASVTDAYFPYLGTVLASTGSWLEQHEEVAARFAAVWLRAVEVILDPAEREFIEPLTASVLGVPDAGAARAYDVLTSERDGLIPDGRVSDDALATVLGLRSQSVSTAKAAGLVDSRLLPGAS
jgi:ABC-type nitrate/sulfonate/bicarbonate transport system substrate-binding protein